VRLPIWGETWTVEGDLERHPVYGYQLHASTAQPIKPNNDQILEFLLRHPAFSMLGRRRIKKLHATMVDRVLVALDEFDMLKLMNAGLSWSIAMMLCEKWRQYNNELHVIDYIEQFGTSRSCQLHIHQKLPYLCQIDLSDPRSLIPLIHDARSLQSRALHGRPICNSSFVSVGECCFILNGKLRQQSLSRRAMLRKLSTVFGDRANAARCLDLAIDAGRLISMQTRKGERITPIGLHIICKALTTDVTTRLRVNEEQREHPGETNQKTRLLLLLTDGLTYSTASENLRDRYPRALHVMPIISEVDQSTDVPLASYFCSSEKDLINKEMVVLHRSETLDLLSLNKFFSRTPKLCSIILAGSSYVAPDRNACTPFKVFLDAPHFPRALIQDLRPERSMSGSHTENSWTQRRRSVHVSYKSIASVVEEAVGQYYSALGHGTTAIVTEWAFMRRLINIRLTAELEADHSAHSDEQRTLLIGSNVKVPVGTSLTWRKVDHSLKRWPGEIGTLTDVFRSPILQFFDLTPVATLGTVRFIKSGDVAVCQADLSDLVPAFCVDLKTAWHRNWDTLIILPTASSKYGSEWQTILSGLAKTLVLLIDDATTQDATQFCNDDAFPTPDDSLAPILLQMLR
jgi:hypothetical protein